MPGSGATVRRQFFLVRILTRFECRIVNWLAGQIRGHRALLGLRNAVFLPQRPNLTDKRLSTYSVTERGACFSFKCRLSTTMRAQRKSLKPSIGRARRLMAGDPAQ
jgi:hypothetical protein